MHVLRQGTEDASELEMTDYGQMVIHNQQVDRSTPCSGEKVVHLIFGNNFCKTLSLTDSQGNALYTY